jgi:hypothetical protein
MASAKSLMGVVRTSFEKSKYFTEVHHLLYILIHITEHFNSTWTANIQESVVR